MRKQRNYLDPKKQFQTLVQYFPRLFSFYTTLRHFNHFINLEKAFLQSRKINIYQDLQIFRFEVVWHLMFRAQDIVSQQFVGYFFTLPFDSRKQFLR